MAMLISRVTDGGSDSGANGMPPPPPRTSVSRFPAAAAAAAAADTSSTVCVIRVPVKRASYSPFRTTIFHDPVVNPLLRGDGGEPDRFATARESKRLWTATGPLIDPRTVKTATCPGSAFKNQALSADRLYSTNRNSLGYDVHRSLRGTSLCSTTKRFDSKPRTSESVGPGSYNLTVTPCRQIHHPPRSEPPKTTVAVLPSDRLKQWGGRPDLRPMDAADEWKTTSEKPSPTVYTFQRARQASWIEQIEERQRRTNPESRRPPSSKTRQVRPEQRLPDFLRGNRNPVRTKAEAVAFMKRQSPKRELSAKDDNPVGSTTSPSLSPVSGSPESFDSLDQQALDSIQGFIHG